MAVNPMQRKSRNSFLLGVLLTVLIAGVVIVFLFLQIKSLKDEQAAQAALKANVYTLTQDVKSGQVLTQDMFKLTNVTKDTIPNNATAVASVIDTWFLQTKDGQMVNMDKRGLYLPAVDSIIELEYVNGQFFKTVNGEQQSVSLRNEPYSDDDGYYTIDSNDSDLDTRVYEETTGNYYIYKVADNKVSREKVYLELNNVPVLAKVDMKANTIITPNYVVQSDAIVTDDVRRQEYNMIVLPADLLTDDYIDIRLMLPSGQDFIVVSKSQVEVPQNGDGTYVADTIWINLRQDEILSLSSAIVEAYGIQGAKLYATKYPEPGIQNAASPTYTPNAAVTAQINSDPNIVQIAMKELASRYSEEAKNIRNQYVQSEINNQSGYDTNIQAGMQTDISNEENVRKQYLDTLGY